MIMKLMLSLLIIVMLKCSRLSSAPTDVTQVAELNGNNNRSNSVDLSSTAYVTNNDDDNGAGNSGVLFQLRRSTRSDDASIEARRRSAVDKGFMRFGRGGNMLRFGRSGNMLRFGRSMPSENEDEENEVDDENMEINEPLSMKMRRANMMRFGRNYVDNDEYNDDASENDDLIDPPVRRTPDNKYSEQGTKILRLGRSSSELVSNSGESSEGQSSREKKPTDGNILRFGRSDSNMMRFGRGNMLRFGRGNVMRFGKRGNMMRFGRAGNVLRFGKRASDSESDDYARSSRASDKNVLRFGKRNPHALDSKSRIYCDDYNCLLQEKENRLIDNEDQLSSLFGNENNDDDEMAKQSQMKLNKGYDEYIITK